MFWAELIATKKFLQTWKFLALGILCDMHNQNKDKKMKLRVKKKFEQSALDVLVAFGAPAQKKKWKYTNILHVKI